MSGNRQHYVPRFLQAGFNSRPGKRAPHTWLYRKGEGGPVEAALTSVGVKKRFYDFSEYGVDLSADAAITEAEQRRLAGLVRKLREGRSEVTVHNAEALVELFAHVHARTKAVRIAGELPLIPLFSAIQERLQDPRFLLEIMQSFARNKPDVFKRYLAPKYTGAEVDEMLSHLMRLKQGELGEEITKQVVWNINVIKEIAAIWLRLYNTRLMQKIAGQPDMIITRFNGCIFQLKEFSGGRLVQGDSPVVFHKTRGAEFAPTLQKEEDFDYAYLPLSPKKVLVASKGGVPVSWEALQSASIACSYEHFIAAEPYGELKGLANLIGSAFPVITDVYRQQLADEAFGIADRADWIKSSPVLEKILQVLGAPSPEEKEKVMAQLFGELNTNG